MELLLTLLIYEVIKLIMPRANRITLGGYVYHVLNRANGRLQIFRKNADFIAFENILAQAVELYGMRICGYCIMSNHWHLLLWPVNDSDLSNFMKWLTLTHTQRYHTSHKTVGIGGSPYGENEWKMMAVKKRNWNQQ